MRLSQSLSRLRISTTTVLRPARIGSLENVSERLPFCSQFYALLSTTFSRSPTSHRFARMLLPLLPLLAATAFTSPALARALPTDNIITHVVHEKRDFAGSSGRWTKGDRVASHVKVPVRVGLKQSAEAMEKAQGWLMEVSHPASGKFGQHW